MPAATLAIEAARRECWLIRSFDKGGEIGFAYARGSRPGTRRRGTVTEVVSGAKSGTFVQVSVGGDAKSYQPEHISGVVFLYMPWVGAASSPDGDERERSRAGFLEHAVAERTK